MNTQDTEKEVKQFEEFLCFINDCPIQADGKEVVDYFRNAITSRDTYWKERVKQVSYEVVKEFQDNLITIAIENEHMRGCVTSNQIIQAFKDFEASTHPALDITNEDNLK